MYLPHYRAEPGYFAPFDAQISRDFRAGAAHGFAAPNARKTAAVYADGDWALLDLSRTCV